MIVKTRHGAIAFLIVAVWLGAVCSPAHATVQFFFGTERSLDTAVPVYNVLPGGTVGLSIYLYERAAPPETSLLLWEDGLFMSQVTVEQDPFAPLPSDPAILSGYAPNEMDFGLVGDPLFGPFENMFTDSMLNVSQFVDWFLNPIGPTGEDLGDGVRRVKLLDVTITAGSAVQETTTFLISDDMLFDETFTFLGMTPLDPIIAPGQFQIRAVPEPSLGIVVLAGTGGGLLLAGLRRRRRG